MFTTFVVLGMMFCVMCLLALAFLHGVSAVLDLGKKNDS